MFFFFLRSAGLRQPNKNGPKQIVAQRAGLVLRPLSCVLRPFLPPALIRSQNQKATWKCVGCKKKNERGTWKKAETFSFICCVLNFHAQRVSAITKA